MKQRAAYFRVIDYGCIHVKFLLRRTIKSRHRKGTIEDPVFKAAVYPWESIFVRMISGPNQLINEKNLGWLGYIGDETTQFYRE